MSRELKLPLIPLLLLMKPHLVRQSFLGGPWLPLDHNKI